MASISVFNGQRWYPIFEGYIHQYFPRLPDYYDRLGTIDLRIIADQIRTTVPSRSRRTILTPLKSLFGFCKSWDIEELEPRVERYLYDLFARDALLPLYGRGLVKSRNTFAALAAFCRLAGSYQVASTLIQVFWCQRRDIVSYERTGQILEWAMALESLRGVADDHDIDRCLDYLSRKFDNGLDSGRGRHFLRPGYYPAPRSRTMPPAYYRPRIPHHPGYLALPAPDPMFHSIPSPAHSVGFIDSHRDAELDEMRMDHDNLAQKVDQLEWNQAELNAAVRMPVHGQLQLPWGGAY